ncbi:hypothetical protein V8E53_015621 [Lactarius tabidus]
MSNLDTPSSALPSTTLGGSFHSLCPSLHPSPPLSLSTSSTRVITYLFRLLCWPPRLSATTLLEQVLVHCWPGHVCALGEYFLVSFLAPALFLPLAHLLPPPCPLPSSLPLSPSSLSPRASSPPLSLVPPPSLHSSPSPRTSSPPLSRASCLLPFTAPVSTFATFAVTVH